MTNSVDPGQTPRSIVSSPGLLCLSEYLGYSKKPKANCQMCVCFLPLSTSQNYSIWGVICGQLFVLFLLPYISVTVYYKDRNVLKCTFGIIVLTKDSDQHVHLHSLIRVFAECSSIAKDLRFLQVDILIRLRIRSTYICWVTLSHVLAFWPMASYCHIAHKFLAARN